MTKTLATTSDATAPRSVAADPVGNDPGLRILLVLSVLMGFGALSTDLYLPALPTMAASLGAAPGTMEFTIAGYLVGFSLGQLLWGPIGDRYGRRVPVALGVLLFTIGSAGCGLSGTPGALIGWRVVQALGACAGVVLARAMVRDLYDRDRAAQMLSTLLTVMAIAPLLGPLLGGLIVVHGSWRMIFAVLVGIGIVTFLAVLSVPETLPAARRNGEPLGRALLGYGRFLRDRRMLGYAGAGGLFYVGIFAYISGTPHAYIEVYGVPTQIYGFLFAAAIAGIMGTNLLNARLVRRLGSDRMLRIGAAGAALSGLVSAVAAGTGWGGLAGLAVPLFAYCAMSGLIVANSVAGALARFPERAGAASALVGALHYGVGIAGSVLVGLFADGTIWPLGWVVASGGMGCLGLTLMLVPQGR